MDVLFSRRAGSDWKKLDNAVAKRLLEKLAIIFDVENDTIFVLRVGHRKDIYK